MYWNNIDTGAYEGMLAETVTVAGDNGDPIHAYYSRPLHKTGVPGLVLIPHMPGWDEFCREVARRYTQHGYAVICPDIYQRFGTGHPEKVSADMRAAGIVSDASVMGDVKGSLDFLRSQPTSSGKVGVIGMCSGGRHAFLAACTIEGFDACVDCWGGGVVVDDPSQLTPGRPVAPIDLAADLSCPVLGIFGNDDRNPTPAAVDKLDEVLTSLGKEHEFHRYDGAGHAFWSSQTDRYRQAQAVDSWEKTFEFFEKYLS
ncbi:MAG: dienelactone hydrolase family protein [Lachnospiraceae bacterium]|nr:dienelactone hydrolase family protein [Lachnospiraceae bacterium]